MLWTEEQLKAEFHHHNLEVFSTKEINHGQQIILRGGSIVNLYSTGTFQVQGKNASPIEKEMVTLICNGQNKGPKVYLFLGSDQEANNQFESKLSGAGIPFASSKVNPLLI